MFDQIWRKAKRLLTLHYWAGFERCSAYPWLRNRVWTKKQLEEQVEYFKARPHVKEIIVGVTSWDKDGNGNVYVTLRPGRHFHIIRWMWERGDGDVVAGCQQGFFTNHCRHIDRKEARILALANGQCTEDMIQHETKLHSEDIWDTPEKYHYKGN